MVLGGNLMEIPVTKWTIFIGIMVLLLWTTMGFTIGSKFGEWQCVNTYAKCPIPICHETICPELKSCPNCELSCPECVCTTQTQARVLTPAEAEICAMESKANTSCTNGLNSVQYCAKDQYAKQFANGCVCKERQCR
jgi:hypothetical protein